MKCKKILVIAASALLMASCTPTVDNTVYYNVTFSQNDAYQIIGANKVKPGDKYVFNVEANPYYDLSDIVVTANGKSCFNSKDNEYIVNGVKEDIFINVEGAKPEAFINIDINTFYFELDNVPGRARNKDYYLEDVRAEYLGYSVDVDVDISKVNFDEEGSYGITYLITDHPEITKQANVVIYTLSDVDDATIDIGYTRTCFVDGKYGEAFRDFVITDDKGHDLTSNDMQFDANNKFNYLTDAYLRTLSLGEHEFTFKTPFEKGEGRKFTLSLIDEMTPQFTYSNNSSSLAFYKGEVNLPTISKNENSIQNITIKYFVDDVECSSVSACNKKITQYEKDYSYKIKLYKNNVELVDFAKKYTVNLKEDGSKYFSFKNNCDQQGDGMGGYASISLTESGNYALDINDSGSGDTNVHFTNDYLSKFNTQDKDYVFVILKIQQFANSGLTPSIWYIDAEKCRDYPNPKDAVGKVDYIGVTNLQKGMVFSLKIKINKTQPNYRETMSNNLIFRDLIGRFEIIKIMFRNYDETIPYYDALFSDIGSFSEYIALDRYVDSDFSTKQNFFVKSAGSNVYFLPNKLFTEMQYDGKKYLTLDIEVTSNVRGKEVMSLYGAHGGGNIDLSSSITLDENGKGKVIVNLKEHYFDIDYPTPFLLGLTIYGSTMLKYDEHLSPSGQILNREEFISSQYYVSDCNFKITNFEFLEDLGE